MSERLHSFDYDGSYLVALEMLHRSFADHAEQAVSSDEHTRTLAGPLPDQSYYRAREGDAVRGILTEHTQPDGSLEYTVSVFVRPADRRVPPFLSMFNRLSTDCPREDVDSHDAEYNELLDQILRDLKPDQLVALLNTPADPWASERIAAGGLHTTATARRESLPHDPFVNHVPRSTRPGGRDRAGNRADLRRPKY